MEDKLSLEELIGLVDKVDSWDFAKAAFRQNYIGNADKLQIWLSCEKISSSLDTDYFGYTLVARYQNQVLGEVTQTAGGDIEALYRKISGIADEKLELKRKELYREGLQEARKILGA